MEVKYVSLMETILDAQRRADELGRKIDHITLEHWEWKELKAELRGSGCHCPDCNRGLTLFGICIHVKKSPAEKAAELKEIL